ncbi:MAG TPA: Hsp70 family protein [Candidatus Hydrogenedens sp.]|nr:Hsp70 family protein [Candidatus Hydrogenedens sp.]HOL20400.1 Hsp70 family protein [Candidatus Hydrogenedens sp.]HPP58905.1 Hsp70 family protein [Candidatus Hydrogenedens sp.]
MGNSIVTCGIDYGTTNTSVAIVDEKGKEHVLDLDEDNDPSTSLPSLVYIGSDGAIFTGRKAANIFIERNVGREVILKSEETGIEVSVISRGEPDKSEFYNPNLTDPDLLESISIRTQVDVNLPGRLFQSLKTQLKYVNFKGTDVFGKHYQIEELVSLILKRCKQKAEEALKAPIDVAVVGRPVHFSMNEFEDEIAERRLRNAGLIAGFSDVVFFYEPVAASVEYISTSETEEKIVMVVDIGGGTCDVCIMKFESADTVEERLKRSQVLAVSGDTVAGDMIDKEIIRKRLFSYFGSNARYGPTRLPLPKNILNVVLDWQNLYRLNTEETINWLIAVETFSDQPEAIRALRMLIQKNCGYPLSLAVENAKKRLSFFEESMIQFQYDELFIQEMINRSEFKTIIEDILEQIQELLIEAEDKAGVKPEQIHLVLTTGGTCLIPAIQQMLKERYSPEKIVLRDTFTSVARGLAVVSRYL